MGERIEELHNKESVKMDIEEFLNSEDKYMLITGTNQYKKHLIVMALLNKFYRNVSVLFRTNAMGNVAEREWLGRFVKKQPKAGEHFRIEKNIYQADSFTNRLTWSKTDSNIDFAIVYPIEAIARKDVKMDCIEDLFRNKNIGKVFLISWTDNNYDYSIFDKYIDRKSIYAAEEEAPGYHKRVMDLCMHGN